MKVMIDQQQEQNIEAEFTKVNHWWATTTAGIYKEKRFIYCVQIDGNAVYQNYEQYIINHIDTINEINIQTLSRIESIQETEKSLDEYLERFMPASLEISSHFFGELSEEHWNQFSDFIKGLDWIVNAMEFAIELYHQENIIIPEMLMNINKLEPIIREMDENLRFQEYAAVGDLIQYEIIPVLQTYLNRRKIEGEIWNI